MITHLRIQNYAIIRSLDIELKNNLSAVTGETGAGKSIVMGALGLILGERADSSVLWNKNEKCIVEGTFNIASYSLKKFFELNDLDYDEETIIRREISEAGKSRAFINDTPVTLTLVKELGERLVDIHSQHETLELNNREFQLEIVDVFSKVQEEVTAYRASFNNYQQLQKQLAQLEEQDAAATRDKDFKQFLLNELLEANLQPGEQEQTETELNTLNNAEDIQLALNTGVQLLREQENAAISMLQEVRTQFQRVAKFNPRIDDLFKRLDSSLIELKDIANEVEDIAQDISSDKQRQEVLTARLDLMYSLQKKHRCNTLEELHSIQQQLSTELENIDSLEAKIDQLKKEQSDLHTALLKTARQISDKRKKHIPALEKSINVLLQQVGMPNAGIQMKQDILPDAQLNLNGVDQLTLLFASNKGSAFQPLNKIASGGELSRLMLCIKTVVAHLTQLPTLIFDEIDTGISGETARQVGDVMKKLAEKHQVICITHLPQIAGKAHQHYFVYKESDSKTTHSNMRLLNSNERIEEIAKMLSGSKPTESALANARELVG
ncbi:MAG: DNA repair protein RecN [Bacteroidia bacterium]|nr:DNA repair protein RecN [Bacteroidia bacterium]MBP7259857.1 DNA repair protein RecN [Bacteroidia bacterium]MBP9179203.1 DNA repair protein RecN [Bacteroidia bacterium]MBP9723504.1 DNA repair protein RecN [Bacteroidia bacterium]